VPAPDTIDADNAAERWDRVDGTVLAIIALVVAMLLAIVVPRLYLAPGRALRKRFVALGSLKGRTRKEIVKAVGQPGTETPLPDGRTLLQWRATGYHIALVFEANGRCFGVTHENGQRVRPGTSQGG
jgi:cobalamin biosynthesis protein CobD/CbiB